MNTDAVLLKISDFAFGGDGIGRLPDGRVCFVPGSVPGDVVRVVPVKEKKNYVKAEIVEIDVASEHRRAPFCPHAAAVPRCPCCPYAATDAAFELDAKRRQYESFLCRGGLSPECRFLSPVPSPSRTGYRTRISLSCENGQAGYRADDNRTLVPVDQCPLAVPEINEALRDAEISSGLTRISFRYTPSDGVVIRKEPSDGRAAPLLLTEEVGRFGRFRTPPGSFFQVNRPVAEAMMDFVLEELDGISPGVLMDLYCGSGFFSLAAALHAPGLKTIGVELDRAAVEAARINAAELVPGSECRFLCCDAGRFRPDREKADPDGTLVLADPPRTGLDPVLTVRLKEWGPGTILYVSCAPDTLRRDVELLSDRYRVVRGRLFDMFPGTAHFESVTRLEKKR